MKTSSRVEAIWTCVVAALMFIDLAWYFVAGVDRHVSLTLVFLLLTGAWVGRNAFRDLISELWKGGR